MDRLQGKRVFLTGASGFIGSNLIRELLKHQAQVHALVRPSSSLWRLQDLQSKITIHSTDITDDDELTRILHSIEPELVIHCAFPTGHPKDEASRQRMIDTGLRGTANLLDALLEVGVEDVITFGSSMVYGAQDEPLSESAPIAPTSFRGTVKAVETQLCRQYAQRYGQRILVLCPFTVYGLWESPTRFIPTIIFAALHDLPIQLTPPGYRHDFIYIEDLVEACILACQTDLEEFEIINVGTSQEWTNEEVVNFIEIISGRGLNREVGSYPPRPWDTPHWVADITKAEQLLGWTPKHNLERGLEKTFSWFNQNLHLYEAHLEANRAGTGRSVKGMHNHD